MRAGNEDTGMRKTAEGRAHKVTGSLNLEAEAAAWLTKRTATPETIAGKVPVVRIRRRSRAASWPASSVSRPVAAVPR
jgi:hypothetical protein